MKPKNVKAFPDQIGYGRTLEFDDFEKGQEVFMNHVQPNLDTVWFGTALPEQALP